MKLVKILLGCLIFVSAFSYADTNNNLGEQPQLLGGDEGTACEVLLCLSVSGGRPSECSSAIRRYFSISAKHWVDTVAKRRSFLNLCPLASNTEVDRIMEQYKGDATGLDSDCTAEAFNKRIEVKVTGGGRDSTKIYYYRVNPVMPNSCKVFANHQYSSIKLPVSHCNAKWYVDDLWKRIPSNSEIKNCWVE